MRSRPAIDASGDIRDAAIATINNFTERGLSQFERHLSA
jgi:hypothetical protein